ncbi:MAG: GntR family transcriptional regulator, transcriptional repressor for pyruvate dehydrogenase complex [Thermoanaerobacteraceae bacterium]|nr:GntR family transcriptional regulator, transcriptional repressor for pyruvate dehydrogenase complex [Thermoanaerobacteraceae bacterium]RKL64046.1 FadR family transcriptional regulator [Thermoanaerobacteraceae bacterium SP2]
MKIIPIKRTTLADEVVEQIKRMIVDGEVKRGEKLPAERELAERFSVGRPTIREALKALVALGILTRKREGTFVNSDISSLFTDPLTQKLILQRISFKELFEVRKLLEVKIAALAAERATEEDIERMRNALKEMDDMMTNDEHKFVAADIAFHEAVAEAAQNEILFELFTAVRHLLLEAQKAVVKSPIIMQNSLKYHKQIFEAIKYQDVAEAEKVMSAHIDDVEKTLKGLKEMY